MQLFFSPSKRTSRTKKSRSNSNGRRPSRWLLLERLEDRTVPSTFLVTNTLDDGSAGSLRWAVNQANADADAVSNINFNIPGSGTQTIAPATALPTITHPVIIDGYTQPGATSNTLGIGARFAGSCARGRRQRGPENRIGWGQCRAGKWPAHHRRLQHRARAGH